VPISGLVVTLDYDLGARALEVLASDARITLGELRDYRLPIVTETTSVYEAEELVNALFVTPGVIFVDVVCIDTSLDDRELAEPTTPSREVPHEQT
jgi:hypothetical protein